MAHVKVLRDASLRIARDIRVARDGNEGDRRAPVTLGWLDLALTILGQTRRYVMSLTPEVIVTPTSTANVNTVHKNREALIAACMNVTQGSALKAFALALMPAAGANLSQALTPATTRCFGVKVKVGDSLNGFKAGGYTISLLDGATTLYQVLIEVPPRCNSFEMIMLGVTSAGGLASIVPIVEPTVLVTGSVNGSATITAQTVVSIQTLNARDLGDIVSEGRIAS